MAMAYQRGTEPFDKIFDGGYFIILWLMTKNVNFPLSYVTDPKYAAYNFKHHYSKELLAHNNDVRGLLKIFPLDDINIQYLMLNYLRQFF